MSQNSQKTATGMVTLYTTVALQVLVLQLWQFRLFHDCLFCDCATMCAVAIVRLERKHDYDNT